MDINSRITFNGNLLDRQLKNLRGLVSFLSTTTNDPEERLEVTK